MPNAFDSFSLQVFIGISGSVGFTGDALTLQPSGGSFTAPFTYQIGDPTASAFSVSITGSGATASVSPMAPVTQRRREGGSPSDMEDVPPNEVQNGTVSGTVPVNSDPSGPVDYTVTLTMVQPSA